MTDPKLCSGFEFVSTKAKNRSSSESNLYPGIAVYPQGAVRNSVPDWPHMEFFIEWRPDEDFDCYYEASVNDQILDDSCDEAFELRGRMFTYAAHLMDCQHRLFAFAVDMFGSYARLYRFDPSCIVVSDLIHYRRDPQLLDQFFVRYSALSRVQRGYDPTVVTATNAEKALFQARVKEYLQRAKEDNLRTHPDVRALNHNVVKMKVHDVNGRADWYLACKCSTIPTNPLPCGRFTRGFIATPASSAPHPQHDTTYESEQHAVKKGGLFWLKDSWRPSSGDSEASIYYNLKDRGVPNLPEIRRTGDVRVGSIVQETMNDTLLSDPSTKSWRRSTDTIRHMIHHRIVSGLLIPLEYVENAKELLLVGRDVLNALAGAFHKGKMLHRDLSKGNVMMTERRGTDEGPWGILNDWDRATRVDIDFPYRTGTWQFMSIALLRDATKLHDIFDDLESLLWVLLFFAVHNFKYTGKFSMRVFDEATEVSDTENGRIVLGGDWKLTWVLREAYKMGFECKPLQDFFNSYSRFHSNHYWKISHSTDNEKEKKVLEDLEAEIKRDIYQLVSHFDDILNDPNTDWSGQEAHNYRSAEALPKAQQNPDDRRDEEMGVPDAEKATRLAVGAGKGKRGQKRKRGGPEPEDSGDDGGRQPKRLAIEAKEQTAAVRELRRRHSPAPPCDRVLRPRTRK
ncbi:hypothetical protein QCA50_008767 [Cerrena zonata]|uniref:Fungal-type protein kinase domain-containing protein n=1 Tax=Cerrena zonata TaxID=2478898 RepID=A0AAW0G9S6_9APHY